MGKIERIQVPSVDRERLEQLIRDRNSPQKVVWRARIVLSAGDGLGAVAIAATVGKSVLTLRRWRRRYANREFLRFLKRIDKETPRHLDLHLIVDNGGLLSVESAEFWHFDDHRDGRDLGDAGDTDQYGQPLI
jgi:hypothetical protein